MSKRAAISPRDKLAIGGVDCPPGQETRVELNVARLATGTWVTIPITVLRGSRPGPNLWLSAAIHGDELNGVEIVRRVLPKIPVDKLRGNVIGVPIVNVFGVLLQSRYLPDRRDLNRSFPGSARGSLASRLAHLFMTEIVAQCQYGIDFHTGSNHRTNYPQLRVDLDDELTNELAMAMRMPITIHSPSRDGSLRAVASKSNGCRVLLYEAGETLRFDRQAIRIGERGTFRVLKQLGMLKKIPNGMGRDHPTRIVRESRWIRASRGGILIVDVSSGEDVSAGQTLARITDTFSSDEHVIKAPHDGVVIGLTTNPLVNRGDAIAHLAQVDGDGV